MTTRGHHCNCWVGKLHKSSPESFDNGSTGFLDRHCPSCFTIFANWGDLFGPPKLGPTWRPESAQHLISLGGWISRTLQEIWAIPCTRPEPSKCISGHTCWADGVDVLGEWYIQLDVRQAARKISHDFQLRLLRFDWIDEPFNHPILKTYKKKH